MAEPLQELQAKLDRLISASKQDNIGPATKNEFAKLIRSIRTKIRRLEKKA